MIPNLMALLEGGRNSQSLDVISLSRSWGMYRRRVFLVHISPSSWPFSLFPGHPFLPSLPFSLDLTHSIFAPFYSWLTWCFLHLSQRTMDWDLWNHGLRNMCCVDPSSFQGISVRQFVTDKERLISIACVSLIGPEFSGKQTHTLPFVLAAQ